MCACAWCSEAGMGSSWFLCPQQRQMSWSGVDVSFQELKGNTNRSYISSKQTSWEQNSGGKLALCIDKNISLLAGLT